MARDYSADWDARRKRVYRRDNYQCQRCGRRGGPYGNAELHCHHIRPKSTGGSDHPSNLQTLCWRCHNRVHRHHVPRNSSRRSRPRSTSTFGSGGSSSQSKSGDSTDVEIREYRGLGPAILKGVAGFLVYGLILSVVAGGLPQHGALGDFSAILGWLIMFAVAHADVGKSSTLRMTGLVGYTIFVLWLSFTVFRGIYAIISYVYLFGILAVAMSIITELEWISGKPEATKTKTEFNVFSKLGYVILGITSWPVTWRLTDFILEALHIVDMAEQTLTSTPTPVSWLIADRIQTIAATFTLSATLFAIFTLRTIADAASISRIERWTITSIQLLLTVYIGWQLGELNAIARTTTQVLLPTLLFAACVIITFWPPLRTFFTEPQST